MATKLSWVGISGVSVQSQLKLSLFAHYMCEICERKARVICLVTAHLTSYLSGVLRAILLGADCTGASLGGQDGGDSKNYSNIYYIKYRKMYKGHNIIFCVH